MRPNPPIAPPIAVPVVHAQRPVAPAPPSIPVVIPPNQPRGWPRILLAVLLAASAMTLGVLAVRKFLPPPSDGVSVTPVLPPVGQEPASAAPTIVRFTVEPDTIEPGGSAQLAWDVAGSTEVEIVPSVGPVAASGSATVSPSSPMNYQLTARGPGGQQAKASVMVDVREKTSAAVSKEPSATKPANKPTPTPVIHPEGPAVQLPPQPPTPAPQEPAPAPTDNASRARQLYQQAAEAKRAAQPAKALELFRAAAELGDFRAMVELGKMYRAGEGVAAEIHESAKWFRKAADGGYTPAMVLVGGLYFEGKAYPKDLPEAVKWFRKAAEANDPLGMDELGLMYANGFGVNKDEKQAFFWFEKAATAGNNLGLFHLARCYERGIGVNKDMALAAGYYEKAAAAGNADARARLAKLGESNAAAVNLAGNQQWTDTGSALKPGDAVTVTASGSLILPPALHAPAMTPAGSAVGCKEAAQLYGSSPGSPAPHLNCWSLIGRVGPSGPIFAVGTSKSFHASTAGELYLGINHENVQQNSGGWKAVVKVGK